MARPRRLPRGEQGARRVELILDTSEAVFGEVGYDAATTNAIAARAGISVGSLYQYFLDKAALFEAVAARYRAELLSLYRAFDTDIGDEPLPVVLDRLLDPIIALDVRHARFKALLCGPASANPPPGAGAVRQEMIYRVEALLAQKAGKMLAEERKVVAAVCITAVEGAIAAITAETEPGGKALLTEELKRMLAAYLAARIGA